MAKADWVDGDEFFAADWNALAGELNTTESAVATLQTEGVQGPAGPAGPTGPAGAAGATGPTGPAGPAPAGTGTVVVNAGVASVLTAATLGAPVSSSGIGQTKILSLPIPANSVAVGTTFRVLAYSTQNTTAGNLGPQLQIGPAGTVSDAFMVNISQSLGASSGTQIEALVTIRSTGTSGTAIANIAAVIGGGASCSSQTVAATVNTTVANFLTLSIAASAGVNTVQNAVIQQIA